MSDGSKLSIAVLYGSMRRNRQGIRAARFVQRQAAERGHDVHLIDAVDYDLPLLDRMYKEYTTGEAPEALETIAGILREADGFLVVSGEYNHGMPPGLKNLMDHFQQEWFFRPSGIVCYSQGPFGGVRAAMQLRPYLGELGTPSISSIFAISRVQQAFDSDGAPLDESWPRRFARFFDEFVWWAEAAKAQRAGKGLPY